MTARIRPNSRLPPPKWRARATAFLATAAAATTISGAATISGATAETVLAAPPATSPSASPAPSPAVPPSALLPPEALPAAARDGFDLRAAMSASDRKDDGTGECGDVVHGRLVTAEASGQGFQSTVPGGQVSELVARTTNPPDLTAWAARAARCAEVTVDDPAGTAMSTITVRPGPSVPGTKTLSYEQLLTLPGQPPELPGLRLRTVAIAADDVLVVLRDAGSTGVDLDTLAVTAWRHAANRLGR
ncbi:hypothetical protein [Amycolatopsis sp. lyj-112]|uniref:hypothetical protein n=1 Tax=Amycolatopsis sp. lyj-112 TaxID=2789288 RepID=UPI00397B0C3A